MYEDSEVVSLVICVISSLFIGRFTNRDIPQFRYLYWGFFVMGVSYLATVAEGFLWQDLFNSIEHLCFAISGLLFAIACLNLYRAEAANRGNDVDLHPSEAVEPVDLVWVKEL